MILIDGVPVMTGIYQILQVLQQELHRQNIPLLAALRLSGDGHSVMFSCPYHKGGQEYRPSCGIATRGHKIGIMHCFSCQKVVYITEMISHCFGKHDGGAFGLKWILDRFASIDPEHRKNLFNIPSRERTTKPIYTTKNDELENYRWVHPYLYKRGMTDELIEMFDLGYDRELKAVTFPIKDINGNVLFVAKRSIKTKRFYLPRDLDKPLCYLYEAKKYYPDSKELYICESLFNSLTCYKFRLPACAMLGTGSNKQLQILKNLGYRKYIICTDGDAAGEKARQKLKKALDNVAFLEYNMPSEGKDLNDFAFCENREEFLKKILDK